MQVMSLHSPLSCTSICRHACQADFCLVDVHFTPCNLTSLSPFSPLSLLQLGHNFLGVSLG
jgi:hypothetical protein